MMANKASISAQAPASGIAEVRMEAAEQGGPVLVTGAARRIGLALAQGFARAGRPVVLHASPQSHAEAEAAAAALVAQGFRARALACDLASASETGELILRAEAYFGPLALLVNSAALFEPDSAADFTPEGLERHFAVNLRAPLQLAQAFAARSPEGARGAIINLIDQRVLRLTPRDFTYTLSKSALWTATRTMAQSFAPRIRVNAIGPGPVLPNKAAGEAGFAREAAGVLLQEAIALESVVEAALYLAQARHVTGQMIAVDSGQHLAWRTPDVDEG
jgi:NAD(P)-dependent dehydrogenase (short-subunit alcohol dehydrogenase family)